MSLKQLTADALIEAFAVEDEPFCLGVATPDGEVVELKIRKVASYGGLRGLEREAITWYRGLPKPDSDSAKRYAFPIPRTADEAIAAYTLHKLIVEPPFDLAQAVNIQKAPWFVSAVMAAIDNESRVVSAVILGAQVEKAKKDSAGTTPDESPSPSLETSGESISTD